jgi:hypothetical protein
MSRTKTVQRLVLAYLLAPLPYLALGLFYDLLIELFAIVNFFGSNVRGWAYSISGGIYMQFVYLWNLVLVVPASIYFIRRRQSGFTWSIALAFIVAVLTYWTTNLLTPGGKQFHPELFEFFWPLAPAMYATGWIFWRIAIRPHGANLEAGSEGDVQ